MDNTLPVMHDCIFCLDHRFSVRVTNCLEKEGIETLTQLTKRSGPQLMALRHFGVASLKNVREVMAYYNVSLRLEGEVPTIQEVGTRQTVLGPAQYIRVQTHGYRRLSWGEVWEVFSARYPKKWAVQFFPPANQVVDQANVYHLFVLEDEPLGFSIHPSKW